MCLGVLGKGRMGHSKTLFALPYKGRKFFEKIAIFVCKNLDKCGKLCYNLLTKERRSWENYAYLGFDGVGRVRCEGSWR